MLCLHLIGVLALLLPSTAFPHHRFGSFERNGGNTLAIPAAAVDPEKLYVAISSSPELRLSENQILDPTTLVSKNTTGLILTLTAQNTGGPADTWLTSWTGKHLTEAEENISNHSKSVSRIPLDNLLTLTASIEPNALQRVTLHLPPSSDYLALDGLVTQSVAAAEISDATMDAQKMKITTPPDGDKYSPSDIGQTLKLAVLSTLDGFLPPLMDKPYFVQRPILEPTKEPTQEYSVHCEPGSGSEFSFSIVSTHSAAVPSTLPSSDSTPIVKIARDTIKIALPDPTNITGAIKSDRSKGYEIQDEDILFSTLAIGFKRDLGYTGINDEQTPTEFEGIITTAPKMRFKTIYQDRSISIGQPSPMTLAIFTSTQVILEPAKPTPVTTVMPVTQTIYKGITSQLQGYTFPSHVLEILKGEKMSTSIQQEMLSPIRCNQAHRHEPPYGADSKACPTIHRRREQSASPQISILSTFYNGSDVVTGPYKSQFLAPTALAELAPRTFGLVLAKSSLEAIFKTPELDLQVSSSPDVLSRVMAMPVIGIGSYKSQRAKFAGSKYPTRSPHSRKVGSFYGSLGRRQSSKLPDPPAEYISKPGIGLVPYAEVDNSTLHWSPTLKPVDVTLKSECPREISYVPSSFYRSTISPPITQDPLSNVGHSASSTKLSILQQASSNTSIKPRPRTSPLRSSSTQLLASFSSVARREPSVIPSPLSGSYLITRAIHAPVSIIPTSTITTLFNNRRTTSLAQLTTSHPILTISTSEPLNYLYPNSSLKSPTLFRVRRTSQIISPISSSISEVPDNMTAPSLKMSPTRHNRHMVRFSEAQVTTTTQVTIMITKTPTPALNSTVWLATAREISATLPTNMLPLRSEIQFPWVANSVTSSQCSNSTYTTGNGDHKRDIFTVSNEHKDLEAWYQPHEKATTIMTITRSNETWTTPGTDPSVPKIWPVTVSDSPSKGNTRPGRKNRPRVTSMELKGPTLQYSTPFPQTEGPRSSSPTTIAKLNAVTCPLWDGRLEESTMRIPAPTHQSYTKLKLFRLSSEEISDIAARQVVEPVGSGLRGVYGDSAAAVSPISMPLENIRINTATSIVCSESTWAVLLVFMVLFPLMFTIVMTEVLIRHVWFRRVPEDIKTRLLADKRYRSYERMVGIGTIAMVCILIGVLVACYLRNGICEDIKVYQDMTGGRRRLL